MSERIHYNVARELFCGDSSDEMFYYKCFLDEKIMGDVYVTFSKYSTAESKFLYTYNLLKKYNKLPLQKSDLGLPYEGKNNNKARTFREEGNDEFQKKAYNKAYLAYNRSVMIAVIGTKDYALALGNRSAALYYLEEYDACISSIHYALAADYPNELEYKLYDREIKCLIKMRKIPLVKLKLEKLSHMMQVPQSRKKIKKLIIENKKLLSEHIINVGTEEENDKNVIRLLGGSNFNIPSLSKFVKLTYSESMGRCLTVTTDVKPGDVLAIEKPYVGMLMLNSLEMNCRNCFKFCLSGIPCMKCSMVVYCDETCQLKSYENGHKYECQLILKFYNLPGMDSMEHLSLCIVLTTICNLGLDRYVATIRALNADSADPIMRGFSADGKLLSDQFCSVYCLEGNESKRTVKNLFMRHCFAAVLVSLIGIMGLKIPDDQLGIIGESVVHIICVVASNAHEISQTTKRKTWNISNPDIEQMTVASLLMPVLSLLNHSCSPNVVRHNYNGIVVLRAIQPIPKNSQLFDNYGQLYAVQKKNIRQQKLSYQYCFQCNCKPCEENWPLYSNLEKTTRSYLVTDMKPDQLRQFQMNADKLNDIIEEMTKHSNIDGLEYIQFLCYYLEFLHNNVKQPIAEYNDCQETIKEVFYRTVDKFTIEHN